MTDQLSTSEIQQAGLDDWRQILDRIKARFQTSDFATALALVNKIGSAVESTDDPEITVTSTEVIVALSAPGGGVSHHELELARKISLDAAALGLAADAAGLTQLELGLDTGSGERLAPFYAALLGGTVEHGEPVDHSGQVPTVWWQDPREADEKSALAKQNFEQRWHFDVWVPQDEGEHRLRSVLDAGGRLVSDAQAPAYWVVEDADGNRSCICTPAGR